MNEPNTPKKDLFIVGIGCSAGGLKALEEFFDYCPSDTGFAFVIIQHLSPDYKSLLPELLSRHTDMSVKETKEGVILEANHVYLIPGSKNIQVEGGKLTLTKRLPSNQINFSVDIFFNSLAIERKDRSLAVVLSGTGSDGTKGSKAIKEIGGTVFVQSPESSGFDGMPKSIIIQGLADFILEPKDIAREIVDFTSHHHYHLPDQSTDLNNEEALNRILKIIKNHIGYDFFSYKKPTLFRRTAKRINITKCKTVEDYIDYLHANQNEKRLLTQEYLIGVTKFFRDYKAFEIIQNQVIPKIAAQKTRGELIKIWTVACSTGEEAYSMAIMIDKYLEENDLDLDYKVFATDLDERAIEVATKGIYNEHIESEVSPDVLGRYFTKRGNEYIIKPSVRKNIIFSKHDILMNPPFNKMDLVSCRNMLIYMENNIQNKVLYSLHYALNLGGYLFLGSSENIGVLSKNFDVISSKWKLYKNIQEERGVSLTGNNLWRLGTQSQPKISLNRSKQNIEERITKFINKSLIDSVGAVCVCVDDSFDIIHAEGKLKKYMHYPEEGYSNNLLKILPDELNIPISTSIRKNRTQPEDTIEKEVKYLDGKQLRHIQILVSSFSIPTMARRCCLIILIEHQNSIITDDDRNNIATNFTTNNEQVIELKEALNETRENLQTTIEELETSNEEMQATNEELLASNEELQSANEELQSLNEELHTVNSELQEKNEQLIVLNLDIENLMKNTNIGTLFLDREFKIRKYTPIINQHFKLLSDDIGRSISHFSGTIDGEKLIEQAKNVIHYLRNHSEDLLGADGKWYTMQIFPYRSEQDAIKGVVVNFIDIDELKQAIDEKEKLNTFFKHLMDYSPAIIYVFNVLTKENVYSSSSIAEVAGYSVNEIKSLGNKLIPTIIHDDDLEKVFNHQKDLQNLELGEILQVEYRVVNKADGKSIWVLSSDKINELDEQGNVKTIIGIAQVITEFKELELKVQESEERFRFALAASRSGLWEWSNKSPDTIWLSNDLIYLLGYSEQELKSSLRRFENLIHKDHFTLFQNKLTEQIDSKSAFEIELKIKTKTDGYRWFRMNGQKNFDSLLKQTKIVGTIFDIDAKKLSEQKMKELNIELERFAYLASHDLKEPLRTITSFTRLFKEEYNEHLNEDATQYLDFIENASARMINLTNDLLEYSQLDNKSLKFSLVDFNKLIKHVLLDLQVTVEQKGGEITFENLPSIHCDATQIKLLFQNLISNSLKYSKPNEKPLIEINCSEGTKYFEFSIKDNGIGLETKYTNVIFEVFKRLHSNHEYEGTGIGLANCKRIVENHNGKIWVNSKVDEGSTFYFTIPK